MILAQKVNQVSRDLRSATRATLAGDVETVLSGNCKKVMAETLSSFVVHFHVFWWVVESHQHERRDTIRHRAKNCGDIGSLGFSTEKASPSDVVFGKVVMASVGNHVKTMTFFQTVDVCVHLAKAKSESERRNCTIAAIAAIAAITNGRLTMSPKTPAWLMSGIETRFRSVVGNGCGHTPHIAMLATHSSLGTQ